MRARRATSSAAAQAPGSSSSPFSPVYRAASGTWLILAGLALVGLGLFCVSLELGRPLRALNVIRNPRTSWMAREAWVAGALFPAGLAAAFGRCRRGVGRGIARAGVRLLPVAPAAGRQGHSGVARAAADSARRRHRTGRGRRHLRRVDSAAPHGNARAPHAVRRPRHRCAWACGSPTAAGSTALLPRAHAPRSTTPASCCSCSAPPFRCASSRSWCRS